MMTNSSAAKRACVQIELETAIFDLSALWTAAPDRLRSRALPIHPDWYASLRKCKASVRNVSGQLLVRFLTWHCHVVVIGGVVGCSVLYHLTKFGWREVVPCERKELAASLSRHAAGQFHPGAGDR